MYLWGLALILTGSGLGLRPRTRYVAAVLLFFSACTIALGVTIFSACSVYAPLSMGLTTSISATAETTLMCLSKDAFDTAALWTTVVALLSAAFGLIFWARKSLKGRAFAYIGAALLVLLAIGSVLLAIFAFMLCSTTWVF